MKQTGVVRKIDELGRIVLPKEIRRNLGIRDGESLEIFVDENGVYLQKFSKILDLKEMGKELCQDIFDCMHIEMMVLDRDKIVASSMESLLGNKVPSVVDHFMEDREEYSSVHFESFFDVSLVGYFLMKPIIISTDCIGMLLFYKKDPFVEWERNLLKFLVQQFIRKIDVE